MSSAQGNDDPLRWPSLQAAGSARARDLIGDHLVSGSESPPVLWEANLHGAAPGSQAPGRVHGSRSSSSLQTRIMHAARFNDGDWSGTRAPRPAASHSAEAGNGRLCRPFPNGALATWAWATRARVACRPRARARGMTDGALQPGP